MNLHKNAITCPNSRGLMVKRVLEERRPVVEVAEEFGVSRSTLYKWIRRYIAAGEAGLKDGSSKPVEIADGRIPAAQAIRQKYAPGVCTARALRRAIGRS